MNIYKQKITYNIYMAKCPITKYKMLLFTNTNFLQLKSLL